MGVHKVDTPLYETVWTVRTDPPQRSVWDAQLCLTRRLGRGEASVCILLHQLIPSYDYHQHGRVGFIVWGRGRFTGLSWRVRKLKGCGNRRGGLTTHSCLVPMVIHVSAQVVSHLSPTSLMQWQPAVETPYPCICQWYWTGGHLGGYFISPPSSIQ